MSDALYKRIIDLYENNKDVRELFATDFFNGCLSEQEKAERILTNFACRDFSFAVHCVTGWEVYEYGSEGDVNDEYWFHSVCKVPDSNMVIDGKGIRTHEEVIAECQNENSTYFVDVDPEPYFIANSETLESFAKFLLDKHSIQLA